MWPNSRKITLCSRPFVIETSVRSSFGFRSFVAISEKFSIQSRFPPVEVPPSGAVLIIPRLICLHHRRYYFGLSNCVIGPALCWCAGQWGVSGAVYGTVHGCLHQPLFGNNDGCLSVCCWFHCVFHWDFVAKWVGYPEKFIAIIKDPRWV